MDWLGAAVGIGGLLLAGYTIRQNGALERERRDLATQERREDLDRARRERKNDRVRDALGQVLAECIHLGFLADLRRQHPNAVTIEQVYTSLRALTSGFAVVSILAPELRIVVGDLPISAANLVSATASSDSKFGWPDVETVYQDAIRLYQEVVSKHLAE